MDIKNKAVKGDASSTGLRAVLNILDQWGCDQTQILKILQISRSTYHRYRSNPESAKLSHDQLERLSCLLNIHAALRVLFDNPENVQGFMSMSNNNHFFNGAKPLDIIATGNFGALYETNKHIIALQDDLR